jgi:transposase
MFQWRRAIDDAGDEAQKGNERVFHESEVKKLKARIAELERALGRKTVDNEILEAAVELAVEKKLVSPKHLPKKRGGR